MANNIKILLSMLAISSVFSTDSIASLAPDYCTKEVLENTPAAKKNSCVLKEFHLKNTGECFVLYKNCKIHIFNPAINKLVEVMSQVDATFPNHQNLTNLRIDVIYNIKAGLAMPNPQSQQQQQGTAEIVEEKK